MSTWEEFERSDPVLAAFGRERIDRQVSFLATVRPDGGPRVHPVTPWVADGRVYVRMYRTSRKVADLRRDPRFALHSMMDNDDGVGGEFAVSGLASEVVDPDVVSTALSTIGELSGARPLVLFELGLDDVLTTEYVGDDPHRGRWSAEPAT
jgi:hypothetical protein